MEPEIIVTPEELYYLGRVMHAKYIDYSYIAVMGDIQGNHSLYESEAKAGLSDRYILEEDFSGNIELSAKAASLLTPIFFGEFESSIDIYQLKDTAVKSMKYHFQNENIVKVSMDKQKWKIQKCVLEAILAELENSLPEQNIEIDNPVFNQKQVTQIIVLKHIMIGQESIARIFFCCDGYLYSENEKQEIVRVSKNLVIKMAHQILIGKQGD